MVAAAAGHDTMKAAAVAASREVMNGRMAKPSTS